MLVLELVLEWILGRKLLALKAQDRVIVEFRVFLELAIVVMVVGFIGSHLYI